MYTVLSFFDVTPRITVGSVHRIRRRHHQKPVKSLLYVYIHLPFLSPLHDSCHVNASPHTHTCPNVLIFVSRASLLIWQSLRYDHHFCRRRSRYHRQFRRRCPLLSAHFNSTFFLHVAFECTLNTNSPIFRFSSFLFCWKVEE